MIRKWTKARLIGILNNTSDRDAEIRDEQNAQTQAGVAGDNSAGDDQGESESES